MGLLVADRDQLLQAVVVASGEVAGVLKIRVAYVLLLWLFQTVLRIVQLDEALADVAFGVLG